MDAVNDARFPAVITDTSKTDAPAPWVDLPLRVPAVTSAASALRHQAPKNAPPSIARRSSARPHLKRLRTPPPRSSERTDFVGIAIHCSELLEQVRRECQLAQRTRCRTSRVVRGLQNRLKCVNPAITRAAGGLRAGHEQRSDHGPDRHPRHRASDGMLAKSPFGCIADAGSVCGDYGAASTRTRRPARPDPRNRLVFELRRPASEITHLQQLKACDDALPRSSDNLRQHGLNKDNTLFVFTVDEARHFASGIRTPQADASNLIYDHPTCTNHQRVPDRPDRRG